MIAQPDKRISKKALKVWRISGLLWSLASWSVAAGIAGLSISFGWPYWIPSLLAMLALGHTVVSVIVSPGLRWKWWRYEVREQEIELQNGIFIIRRTLIPMVRVQHVDTFQGPILRRYRLATVRVSTAATTHDIPALAEEEAEYLRNQIGKLARVAEDDDI